MRGLVRLLFMFGPMIVRQVQKYQRNKQRQQQHQQPQQRQHAPQQPRQPIRQQREQPAPPPPPPAQPKLSEDEKNFKMKEEEFMLDETIIENYEGVAASPDLTSETLHPDTIEEYLEEGKEATEKEVTEEEILDLKNVFFNKEDDVKDDLEGVDKA